MKNKFKLLLLLPLIVSCTKDVIETEDWYNTISEEIVEVPISEDGSPDTSNNDTTSPKKEFTLYQESVLNQRSGTGFTWDNTGGNAVFNVRTEQAWKWMNQGHQYQDVNNDGNMDILVSINYTEDDVELVWLINQGDGRNYVPSSSYFTSSTIGVRAHKILKTDVNNDRIPDYVVLGVDERVQGDYNGNFTVIVGKEGGMFDVINIDNSQKLWFHNGAAGDLNGDGNVDVIAATYLWWGDGTGNFVRGHSIDTTDFSYTQSPLVYEIIDMNNDSYNDLILRGPKVNTTIVLNNNGVFDSNNEIIVMPDVEFKAVMDIEVVDFDNDGDWDLVELAQIGGNPPDSNDPQYFVSKLTIYFNDNMNFYSDETTLNESFDGNYTQGSHDKFGWTVFKFDDIDGDGQDEILAENFHDSEWNVLKKQGNYWEKKSIIVGN